MSISKQNLEFIESILGSEAGISSSNEEELQRLYLQERISQNPVLDHGAELTTGQRAADWLAKFAGSWLFIMIFFMIIVLWITLNAFFIVRPFDVYPYILLNLILSCLAAIQAPVIMMSQNRQAQIDRLNAENDFKVNIKAEILIETIHEKLDVIIDNQCNIANR
ncbi:MAG: DUF1003 domain-containing protein, partial [bacterium]|nr:DUF1003 domain-containing protein [bacterium]